MSEIAQKKENKYSLDLLGKNFKNGTFTPDETAKGMMLFIIFQTIVTLIYQGVYFIGGDEFGVWSYVFTVLLDACFVLAVYFIAQGANRNMFDELKVRKAPTFGQILLCGLLAFVCIFGFSGLTNIFMQLLYNAGYVSTGEDIVVDSLTSYMFFTVVVCILPALCEEILFRGLIFNGLKRISTKVGVFGSAFLFMIMHGNPDQTVHQFILGVVLAIVYLATNNLWVPILLHFFNNFIAVSYAYFSSFQTGGEVASGTVEIYFSEYLIYAIVTAVVGFFIAVGIVSALKKSAETKKEQEPQKETFTGTLGAEIGYGDRMAYETASDSSDVIAFGSNDKIYRPTIESNNLPLKLSKQGKFLYGIAIAWLAADWILALIVGFNYVGV